MEFTIDQNHHGMLIREYLKSELQFSRRIIKGLTTSSGNILVNGQPKTVRYLLASGDILTVIFPPEKRGNSLHPECIPLEIVYEDDDLLIINKSGGMATIPSQIHRSGTVANGLLAYYESKKLPYTVHVVTRLDRDTSGLLLVAKHRYSHSLLSVFQKEGKIIRKYKAIIEGHLKNKQGTIIAPIGRKEGSIIKRTVTEAGQEAVTYYKVRHELLNHTLVDIELGTGRTHQIRVHFSHLGYPLAGDDLYGGTTNEIKRQALHCYEISFRHPVSGELICCKSQLPKDMNEFVERA